MACAIEHNISTFPLILGTDLKWKNKYLEKYYSSVRCLTKH